VYSTNPSRLLWTGTTSTLNPNRMIDAVNEVTEVVYKQMVKDGFIMKEQKWKKSRRS
jgi:membrane peptidoglycan carboxypeptidase